MTNEATKSTATETFTVYAHKVTVRYYDYGSFLSTSEGLNWSTTGKAEDATGFERGNFDDLFAAKLAIFASAPASMTFARGEDVARSCDMNPHGLI